MKHQDRLEKLGYQIKGTIGCGDFGCAYDIGSNKALKFTEDSAEAYTAIRLLKGSPKFVNKIYRVFKFKKTPGFFIEQDKLKPKK